MSRAPEKPAGKGASGLSRVLGRDRRTRLISLATIAALAVAAIAFIALSPDDDSIPRDRYTLSAERLCLQSKERIAAAAAVGGTAYARQLVPIVVRWREELEDLKAPEDRQDSVQALDDALREVEIEAAVLARVSSEGDRARSLASSRRTELASAEVEEAIADLGLSECAEAKLGILSEK